MSDFDRIEETRERNEGLAYDEWRDRHPEEVEYAKRERMDDDAYDLDDPKHPTFHERFSEIADTR